MSASLDNFVQPHTINTLCIVLYCIVYKHTHARTHTHILGFCLCSLYVKVVMVSVSEVFVDKSLLTDGVRWPFQQTPNQHCQCTKGTQCLLLSKQANQKQMKYQRTLLLVHNGQFICFNTVVISVPCILLSVSS